MKNHSAVLSLLMMTGLAVTPLQAASRARLNVAVYSSGFLVDTRRTVVYGKEARRVETAARATGSARGDVRPFQIEIDRLDQGMRYFLDPRAKSYTQSPFQRTAEIGTDAAGDSSGLAPAIHLERVVKKVSGPLGTDMISGYPCQAYTIRIEAEFVNAASSAVVATETLLEKLWVTERAPAVAALRADEKRYAEEALAKYGSEDVNFGWLLRLFNQRVLDTSGRPGSFILLVDAYQSARAQVPGATVRQLVTWGWRPKPAAGAAPQSTDMTEFLAAIAAGLGAPPEAENKDPLQDNQKPQWVIEMEKDFGRTGPTAMMRSEVVQVRKETPDPQVFEVPVTYQKM